MSMQFLRSDRAAREERRSRVIRTLTGALAPSHAGKSILISLRALSLLLEQRFQFSTRLCGLSSSLGRAGTLSKSEIVAVVAPILHGLFLRLRFTALIGRGFVIVGTIEAAVNV